MSPRAVCVIMIFGIILILFVALWGFSFIWEPIERSDKPIILPNSS